jgi:hypothetical protein
LVGMSPGGKIGRMGEAWVDWDEEYPGRVTKNGMELSGGRRKGISGAMNGASRETVHQFPSLLLNFLLDSSPQGTGASQNLASNRNRFFHTVISLFVMPFQFLPFFHFFSKNGIKFWAKNKFLTGQTSIIRKEKEASFLVHMKSHFRGESLPNNHQHFPWPK